MVNSSLSRPKNVNGPRDPERPGPRNAKSRTRDVPCPVALGSAGGSLIPALKLRGWLIEPLVLLGGIAYRPVRAGCQPVIAAWRRRPQGSAMCFLIKRLRLQVGAQLQSWS